MSRVVGTIYAGRVYANDPPRPLRIELSGLSPEAEQRIVDVARAECLAARAVDPS